MEEFGIILIHENLCAKEHHLFFTEILTSSPLRVLVRNFDMAGGLCNLDNIKFVIVTMRLGLLVDSLQFSSFSLITFVLKKNLDCS